MLRPGTGTRLLKFGQTLFVVSTLIRYYQISQSISVICSHQSCKHDHDDDTGKTGQRITWFWHIFIVNETCDCHASRQETWHGLVIVIQLPTYFQPAIRLKATWTSRCPSTHYLLQHEPSSTNSSVVYRRHHSTEKVHSCPSAMMHYWRQTVVWWRWLSY